ncbi:MAG: penicillin-binding transpeptidase domain-containing protein [Pseudomonadota bacterium]
MQKGKFSNERRKRMFATTETNQPGQCITVVCLVTELLRLSAPTKLAGVLLLAALTVLSLGSRTSADTIDVGHFVVAAGGQVESVAIIVERHPDGQIWTSNTERAMQRFSPASTSKIPHTLIALEHGLATLETVFAWDGVPRSVRAWNQDHTLETAFQKSIVWVYQEIARTAGQDMMSSALADFGYGNVTVGSIDQLTTYWLNDTLQISAAEQVAFLSGLAHEQFPLSASTYTVARDIMISDADGSWVMRSKTGWRYSESDMDIGWFVGWLECANETYVFALNMDMPDTRYLSKRRNIAYSVLEGIEAFDCD